ncbi:MAG: phosphate signaling complex protein PhoU [Syntrophaceae bacterium]
MLEEKQMTQLKRILIENATLVEGMIAKSVKGLRDEDAHILRTVIEQDETKANDYEITIDELCVTTIARYQPNTKALRTILMALNISSGLERMADHAVTIAESGLYLIEHPIVKPLIDIPRMGEITISMLKDAITAFIDENPDLALKVCERDSSVDGLRNQIARELVSFMIEDPKTIERALQLSKIASNLERIADLATNIGEDVIYMVKGTVIKHHKDQV